MKLAANLFWATQAEDQIRRENISGKERANQAHRDVGTKVRRTIKELGGTLPEHVRRPVLMVLLFGLRSSAVCALSIGSFDGEYLRALDKGGVRRLIPVDAMLAGLLSEAAEWRAALGAPEEPGSALFVDGKGRAWERTRLSRAAQGSWEKAGLGRKVLHEIRHTLGTLAGRSFPARMVKAAMGHQSEASSLAYWHPDEEMAGEVRRKIVTYLSPSQAKHSESEGKIVEIIVNKDGSMTCPCCNAKLFIQKS